MLELLWPGKLEQAVMPQAVPASYPSVRLTKGIPNSTLSGLDIPLLDIPVLFILSTVKDGVTCFSTQLLLNLDCSEADILLLARS